MGDVKQIRRLQTSAQFEYGDGPGGVPTVVLAEHKDGGPYDLHPLTVVEGNSTTLLLPSAGNPSYSVGLRFDDTETAARVGRAILGIANKGKGGAEEEG